MLPYILYINLKNLDWPAQNILPHGQAITQKPQAIFITGMTDFAQIDWLQDWVYDGCEVTVELVGEVSRKLPIWVTRVSFANTQNGHPALDAGSKQYKFEEKITPILSSLPILKQNTKLLYSSHFFKFTFIF